MIAGAAVIAAIVIIIVVVAAIQEHGRRPDKKTINVPYTSQAPAGNWSEPWGNACEETSIYMVSSFYANDPIKRDAAIKNIKNILAVKKQDFKVSKDESLQEISDLIKALGFPWTTKIVNNPTEEQLKQELSANRPIIVPVFAPTLGQTDGADYHVMVLIGYDDATKTFIVNDPGITNGQNRHFPYDTFMAAIHDLNQKDYQAGESAVLFTQQSDWTSWFTGFNGT
jgi:hypothetical protein